MRRSLTLSILTIGCCLALAVLGHAVPPGAGENSGESSYRPTIAKASGEGERAAGSIRVPKDVAVKLFAAEPMVANPVSFCLDEKGRLYVVETFRLHHGVTDNRSHMNWIDDDVASKMVEDRIAMYRKYLGADFATFAQEHDRIRLIVDKDGDGKADHDTIFVDGFNNAEDGLASGVLARKGDVWFTCIPDLWKLRDENGDGTADVKTSLQKGYGIHVAFLGHDLHGLRFGPDGKLYFSIGDRGLHVQTEGRLVSNPDSGAVLRCNPDGSELEIFANGLRNPQELAFDIHGNLFTCDNNSDSGDKARAVYLVEGGDSGWRIGYQYLEFPESRGPWNAEKLWYPQWDGQAAYLLPPLINIADGPSGFTYEPGVSRLPERYRHHFFLCDFRGAAGQSGIRSFATKPKGASFEVVDAEQFLWGAEATDADFGPDGSLYVSDWVTGWNLTGKGRIYRVAEKGEPGPKVQEVKALLADDLSRKPAGALVALLDHDDMRVRQEAQFALAERKEDSLTSLSQAAKSASKLTARLHAIWGLGQLGRARVDVAGPLLPLLKDSEAEVRAQAAKVLGELKVPSALEPLIGAAADSQPRVRFFAAMALGKLGRPEALPALLNVLRDANDREPYLRHAAVMGLTGINSNDLLAKSMSDSSSSVRMGVLLAMRRLNDSKISGFLNDSSAAIVLEAARAIYDAPIPAGFEALAALADRPGINDEPLLRRVINANARLGDDASMARLANLASRSDLPESIRIEAIEVLGETGKAMGRDRITGLWRPQPPRSVELAAEAFRKPLPELLRQPINAIRLAAIEALGPLPINDAGKALLEIVSDTKLKNELRVGAVQALDRLHDSHLAEAVKLAVHDKSAEVRVAGQRLLATLEPAQALTALEEVLEHGSLEERQGAFTTLGKMPGTGADGLLAKWLDKLKGRQVAPEVRLDLLEASKLRPAAEIKDRLKQIEESQAPNDPLATYRAALAGGNAKRGSQILREKAEVSCLRCHKVNGRGGEVGPELTGIGSRHDREYLLAAIVTPNAAIAKGFETVVIARNDGQVVSGVLKEDDGQQIRLLDVNGKAITVPKSEIEEQTRGASAMPDDVVKQLSKSEIRDLVEYLAGLK
ncbi:PVC-type heme-binding CxxCH protein [Singulisphaera sp. PoT]|uniref:PVC-type heme-binding CxxCH protein n=1 Tax=Singulisphaera sp. PoT TaxID=3411797 RepID=UPI003BF53411